MSIIHFNQIKSFLETNVFSLISISDLPSTIDEDEKNQLLLSRSLSAYSIQCFVEQSIDKIANYVIDGTGDNGIDCFYYDDTSNIIYISQAKWSREGTKTIERGDIQKFIKGIKDLINSRYERFNEKLQPHTHILDTALQHPNTKIKLIITYPGSNELASEPQTDIEDFIEELNDTSEVISYHLVNQSFLHRSLSRGLDSSPIKDEIILENWGFISEPFEAYFGIINGKQLADLYKKYEKRLFTPNIRSFLANSEINIQIEKTVKNEPLSFFYYNNGVTFTTESTTKKLTSGTKRASGVFYCQNISVINGAQTIGAIARASAYSPEKIEQISVLVKIITLKNSPDDFQSKVTKAANTQNTVGSRDFISQDEEQERLKRELQIEGIYYSYKRGDYFQNDKNAFDFEEAISALANVQNDIKLVTKAKREIGVLWKDISKTPYKALFNPSLSSIKLWNVVQLQRIITSKLAQLKLTAEGKDALMLIHGNKFISYLVFQELKKEINIEKSFLDTDALKEKINTSVEDKLLILNSAIESKYPDDYLGNLFKTVSKCEIIHNKITGT